MDQLVHKAQHVTALCDLLAKLPHGAAVAVDTETTGLFPYQGDVLRGVSLAFRDPRAVFHDVESSAVVSEEFMFPIMSFYLPVSHPLEYDEGETPRVSVHNLAAPDLRRIFRGLKERNPFLVLHHGKFDFAFLRHLPTDSDGSVFFPFPNPTDWWDTKIVAWLLDENMPTGLKEQAEFHWGIDQRDEQKAVRKLVKEKGWGGLTARDIVAYGAKDAELTLRLFELQCELMVEDHPTVHGNPQEAIRRELAVQGVLYRMIRTGVLIDPARVNKLGEEIKAEVERIQAKYDINLGSTQQVSKLLFDGEVKSTAKDVLQALEQTELVTDIIKHRQLSKAGSAYVKPYQKYLGYDGRLHPLFASTGTRTGRFSCAEPNLQTIPRGDTLVGVRDVFVPEVGFELWEFDLSAAEMRVVAGMADEQVLIDSLNEGVDMHAALAERVFGEKWTPIQRRYAKNIGYGWFYGLSDVKTAAKYISGPDGEKIAKRILTGLKKMYPKVYRYMNRMTRLAEMKGYLPLNEEHWPGRYRRFVTQAVLPARLKPKCYTALNAMVQGGIGEFMKDVMLEAEEPIEQLGARLCLQVHDSLVIEVPEGLGEKVQQVLQDAADDLNPFDMRMIFDAAPWGEHD